MTRWRRGAALLGRFGIAGALNTLFGFAVIAALDVGLGLAPALANAGGYAAGLLLSYWLNRLFVFRASAPGRRAAPRFIAVAAAAFGTNQLALAALGALLGDAEPARLAAQLGAMATYTAATFLGLRYFVFREEGARS